MTAANAELAGDPWLVPVIPAWRAARALGYRRAITCTQAGEAARRRAVGWHGRHPATGGDPSPGPPGCTSSDTRTGHGRTPSQP